MYIYENHLGGLYATEDLLDYENLHCETCGDSDTLLGKANTREEFLSMIDIEGWNEKYLKEFLDENFS